MFISPIAGDDIILPPQLKFHFSFPFVPFNAYNLLSSEPIITSTYPSSSISPIAGEEAKVATPPLSAIKFHLIMGLTI